MSGWINVNFENEQSDYQISNIAEEQLESLQLKDYKFDVSLGQSASHQVHQQTPSDNRQIESSSSGCLRRFTVEESEERQQKVKKSKARDKLLKNGQLFVAIRENKTCEEKIKRIKNCLEQGAEIDAVDKNDNDNTPLHVAVLEYEPEIANELLERGAVIDPKNADGETPIDIAKRLQQQNIIDIFKVRTTSHQISPFKDESQSKTKTDSTQEKKAQNHSQSSVKGRSGAQGLHGYIYQLKLLMLFLNRGLVNKYSFWLSTENEAYKKFDDLVFEIINEFGEKEYRLLQAKHKTDKSKTITFDNLLTESDGDYSLAKYFFSYYDLKKKLINKGVIRDVTVCTNIDFDPSTLCMFDGKDISITDIVEPLYNCDDILFFKSNNSPVGSKRYQFKREIIQLLKPVLLKYNLTRLAQRLAECVAKNNIIQHHCEPFKSYHIILAEEVIDTKKKIFSEKFVNGCELYRETSRFREIFKEEICKKLHGFSFENINQEIVKRKPCFMLSKRFGVSEKIQKWPENNETVYELAKKMIEKIFKAEIIDTNGVFKLYHVILAKEVIDTKNKKFRDEFVNGEGLSEEAQKFRHAIGNECRLQGELSLKDISKEVDESMNKDRIGLNLSKRFGEDDKNKANNKNKFPNNTISSERIERQTQGSSDEINKAVVDNLREINKAVNDNKPRKSWPIDAITDEDINDFLDHLVFAVNQPNEEELGKIIENDIGKNFNFSERDYVYNELFVKMLDWLNGKGEEFISYEDGKSLFDEIENKLSELELTAVSLENEYEINKYDINFKETFDSRLINFLKVSDKTIFHITTKQITLSAIKVYNILINIPEYEKYYNYIFVKLHFVLRQQNRVKQALKRTKNVLVIICKASMDIHEEYSELFNIIKSSNNKNILISDEIDLVDQKFKSDSSLKIKYDEVIDSSIKFSDLSPDSQTKVLKESSVIFQGKTVSIGALITDEESNLLLEADVLFQLINDEKVEIGNAPFELREMDSYLDRKLHFCDIEEIFKKEFFFTYNSNIRNSSFDKNQDIVLISDSERDFEKLCSTYINCKIHWLQKKNEELVWVRSSDNCFTLIEFRSGAQSFPHISSTVSKYKPVSLRNVCINSSQKWQKGFGRYFNTASPPGKIERFIYEHNLKIHGKDITDRVVILSADPGMGKSTMLTYLAEQSKELDNFLWIEKIDLKNHTRSLRRLKFHNNLAQSIDFLSCAVDLKTHFEKELFKLRVYKQGKIMLLFDGFDEISPHYKKIVLEMFHALRSTEVERIWITTRPHLTKEIKDKLSADSYTIKLLSIDEQKTLLKNIFSQKFDKSDKNEKFLGYYSDKVIDVFLKFIDCQDKIFSLGMSDCDFSVVYGEFSEDSEYLYEMRKLVKRFIKFLSDSLETYSPDYIMQLIGHKAFLEKRLDEYTNKLLKTISKYINDTNRSFTGVPLHLRMLAELFLDNFKDFYDSEQDESYFPEISDLVNNIHELCLEKKYKIYWRENNKADLTIPSVIVNCEKSYLSWKFDLKLLAVSMLFDGQDLNIISEENRKQIDDVKQNIKYEKERVGIISLTTNGTPTFIHNTFAEYLAAEYICDKLKSFSSTDNLWSFLDKTIFIIDYQSIRRFFEQKLAKDRDLASVSSLTNSEVFYENHLYIAAEENLVKLIEFLLKIVIRNKNLLIRFEKTFKKAVDTAVSKHHEVVVEVLFKYVKHVGTDGIIQDVSMKYLWKSVLNSEEKMIDILLKHIENENQIVQILKSEQFSNLSKNKFQSDNVVYNAVNKHCLTGNHALFKHIKRLNYDQRFDVLYSLCESIELTGQRMYLGPEYSPMHRAKQMADCCDTCGKQCQQYMDLCSLVDDIWEVHEHLIHYSCLSTLEVAMLLAKIIAKDLNAVNIIRVVLKTKSDTNRKDIVNIKVDGDKTLLHLACGSILKCRSANLDMIKFLVDHKADINVQDKCGRTPLHFSASACNSLEVVKYLVQRGADFTAVDSLGKTPLILAAENGNFEVVQYLEEK